MSDPAEDAVPPPAKLPEVESPPPDQVLDGVPSPDEILEGRPSVDEIVERDG